MLEPIRAKQVEKPETIVLLANNTYYYNFDIKLDTIQTLDAEESGWSYIPVYIQGNPNYKDCVRHIIRQYISQDEEFDLINSYNKSILQLKDNTVDRLNYLDYLNLVDRIKLEVKNQFK